MGLIAVRHHAFATLSIGLEVIGILLVVVLVVVRTLNVSKSGHNIFNKSKEKSSLSS